MGNIILLIMFIISIPAFSFAATINVVSPYGSTQVQAAIEAADEGDIVSIPASDVTWSSDVTLDKNITLQGAGKTSTKVTWNTAGYAIYGIGTFRITNIGFTKGADGSGIISIPVDSSAINWRVDHCDFSSASNYGESILVYGGVTNKGYGLADNNTHVNMRAVQVYGNACDPEYDKEWSSSLSLGTANAVYVEDSTITNTISQNGYEESDQNCGGRIVFRHNTVTDFNFGIHSVQGDHRAARSWEFYNNTFISSSLPPWVVGHIRGGTGVVFNNTIEGSFGANIFLLDNIRSCYPRGDIALKCNGSSTYDGNTTGGNGYPCRDQIGRSTDASQWTAGSIPSQILEPAYFFNNKKESTEVTAEVSEECPEIAGHIQENRDYYNYDASFDGTSGVGVGLFTARPVTCTVNTAYFATDAGSQGTLYKCTATNTWTKYYEPYTYPHPLRGENARAQFSFGSGAGINLGAGATLTLQ